jgi:hypothetical protein
LFIRTIDSSYAYNKGQQQIFYCLIININTTYNKQQRMGNCKSKATTSAVLLATAATEESRESNQVNGK